MAQESIESTDTEQTTDTVDTEPTLFQIKIEVMVKDFMSQKMGNSKGFFQVNVNKLEEFLQCVWSMVESHINREISYDADNDSYQWANYELDCESMDRFVVFYDKASKRTTEISQISNKILQAWTKKQGADEMLSTVVM